ncbi:Dihydrofolate reductase [Methylobacterium sp. 4-46]|uniref:dihydrofolate reductase n=1 Tax=unclassified Methylobacterium TaxID=2615210 RepID=UPI000165C77A|nr:MULTISPECIES: dihydrofolate reductase [Methylobacterium]ACA15618.1 Dihydrofolate reductase [Methylobacterium sp. 4-46]WFT81332.1 dihydrofolate reductase [Methylobacterium nodulans]
MPRVTLIAAVARNGVIGRDNDLAWRLRGDLRRFRALTMGKPVVMGRRTWDSIGRPLPGRRVIVMTRDPGWSAPGVETAAGWDAVLALVGEAEEVMVAGGAQIYALTLPLADRIELTEVAAAPEGDARFPEIPAGRFREVASEAHPAGPEDEHPYRFVTLDRHV